MTSTPNRSIRLDATRCAEARARRGSSREHLAAESRGGLSVATLKRIEGGAPVYLDTARRFAALVDAPLESLMAPSHGSAPPAATEPPATIAVLPFDVMDDDRAGHWFADGLVEDVITRLGQHWFPVIARGSTFRYREARPDPRTVGAEFAADYVMEGSVRRVADTVRVTARLTETGGGHQVWASSYDRALKDVFTMQDALVATIVGQAHGTMLEKEVHPLLGRDPKDLSAWELSLRGSWSFHQRTREMNLEARRLFEQALQREPHLRLAWYFLAMTHQRAIVNQWSPRPDRSLDAMKAVCAEFGRHFPGEPRHLVATAYCGVYTGDRASAMARLQDAIELDPNSPAAYSLYGQTLAMGKRPDEAIEQFEIAMRLSPRDTELWAIQSAIALCHFVADRLDEMLSWAERAVQMRDDMPFPHGIVAVAQAYLGNRDAARASVAHMLRLEPQTSTRGMHAIVGATSPDIAARYLEGLQMAGVPA